MNKKWMILGLLLLGSTLQAGDCSDASFHDIDDPILNNMLESCSDINNYKLPQIEPSIPTFSSRSSQKRKATDSDDFFVLPQITLPSITTATLSTNTQLSKKKEKTQICNYIVNPETGDTCGKRFEYRNGLTEHTRTHTGESPFKCLVCDQKFKQKSAFTVHTRIHTGEKSFKCSTCNKRFAQSSNLREHIKTHTGKKPFACTICDQKFKQKSAFTVHTRTHTGEKPFKCLTCNKGFKQPSNLINHKKTKKHLAEVAAASAALALAQGDNNE